MTLETIREMLEAPFMQRAFVVAILVGVSAPAVGTYLVQRGMALMGDGIGHVALTGVAGGWLAASVFGLDPKDSLAIPGAIAASVVSMCGQVGWVGLLVPHCARMLCGQNNRAVIPVSLLLGSALMIVIDTLARSLSASEIPISILTAIIGAPFFIVLLRRTGGAR